MYVDGRSSQSVSPPMWTFAVSPCSFDSSPKRTPACAARASRNQNPALCRVGACSAPGLPRPTMRRSPATSKRRAAAGRSRRRRDGLLLLRRRRGGFGLRDLRGGDLGGLRSGGRLFLDARVLGDDDRQVVLL